MSQTGIIQTNAVVGATTYTTMAGNAAPVAGVLTIVGTNGITTSGAGGTVTISSTDPSISGSGSTVGAVTGNIITFPCGAVAGTYTFDIKVSAFESTTPAGAGYTIVGSVRTSGAAATLIPGQTIDVMEEAALVACDAYLTVAGNNAIIQVLGTAGLTVNWKAISEYVFVS